MIDESRGRLVKDAIPACRSPNFGFDEHSDGPPQLGPRPFVSLWIANADGAPGIPFRRPIWVVASLSPRIAPTLV